MAVEQEQPPFPMLLDDEPEVDTILFDFERKAEDLSDIISLDRKSPFAILLNGEWGSGKTTLMKATKLNLEQKDNLKTSKIIWFDAWQYEGFDPRSALFTMIIQEYKSESLTNLTGILKRLPSFDFGINLGLISFSSNSEKLIQQYVENIDKINNLHSYLEKEVIKDKLVVFIDDLDRCSIENTLNILESIKIFLSIKNTTYIVGADIEKLEKAWELRYNKHMMNMNESKNHLDKIFQLNINLPPKDNINMEKYLNSLGQNEEILNSSVKELLLNGCKPNPRSFKRVLNLINMLWFLCKKYNIEPINNMIIITSLAILSIQYPPLLKLIRATPKSFFELAFLAINYDSIENLKKYEKMIQQIDYSNLERNVSPTQLRTLTNVYSIGLLQINTVRGLEYLLEDKYAFGLMRTLGMNNHYRDADNERLQKIEEEKRNEISTLLKLIDSSSLFI